MRLDFWNNPIVVSAFRVKYRRGGLFGLAVAHIVLLGLAWMVLQYYSDLLRDRPWPRFYFLGVVGVQLLLSGLIAGNSTAASIKAEVAHRTLDFQRIAALSPREILLGKLLGEPALAYLLIAASMPLAMIPVALGAVRFDEFLMAYLTLVTTTLFCGALGLLNRLEPPAGKASGGGGSGAGLVISYLILSGIFLMNSREMMQAPWSAAIAGLISPTAILVGLYRQDVWGFAFPFYGGWLPLVAVTPILQLLAGYFCFHIMVRRLINPLNPPVSKGLAYIVLIVIDVLAAGVLFDPLAGFAPWRALKPPQRVAVFCLVHVVASLWMTTAVTPWKESLQSWVWRYRGRLHWTTDRFTDQWLGPRSENTLALVTFCLIGLAGLVLLVVLPAGGVWADEVLPPLLTMVMLILALGVSYQWALFAGGRGVGGALLVPLAILIVAPHILGAYYHFPLFLSLSVSAQFASWFGVPPPLEVWPLLALYGLILIVMWLALRGALRQLTRVVDRKLEAMGVRPAREEPPVLLEHSAP